MSAITATDPAADPAAAGASGGRVLRGAGRLLRPLGNLVTTMAAVIVLWIIFLQVYNLDPLVAKSPADVWRYLFEGAQAGDHRSLVASGLGRTLLDAGVGFAAGLVAAVAVSLVFVLARSVEQALLPMAVVIRSVPLVAMTPLITLVFGRGLLATTVISGLIVFFPALVTMSFGLRSASRQAADLCRAYGGGDWMVARKVMLPSAVPAFFASARVGVPGALIGAMLAEWLSTGQGLGYAMLKDSSTFDYDHLWASVAVLTAVSALCYNVILAVETLALARFAPASRPNG
ncbi:ABC transporter permease [Actinacidiphila oryziradicis]|jgi:ABC-type nitrate/sulfonate/bicarbonate transport system permease component|uniref:ABC transporter permease subunit n=1 Tax=Actinacidiphila oryziradicis TaxID=2571141 RepID=A0A4U0SL02_9ACTN|nr:ABC transporter permease subunit [Actinacidiphila oryziradicis]TKA10524.1 ABC transporter permease subunit [Actinacidiphila oryziradicis]